MTSMFGAGTAVLRLLSRGWPRSLAEMARSEPATNSALNQSAGSSAVSFTPEWRDGAAERQPPMSAWRSFRAPRFKRGQRPRGRGCAPARISTTSSSKLRTRGKNGQAGCPDRAELRRDWFPGGSIGQEVSAMPARANSGRRAADGKQFCPEMRNGGRSADDRPRMEWFRASLLWPSCGCTPNIPAPSHL